MHVPVAQDSPPRAIRFPAPVMRGVWIVLALLLAYLLVIALPLRFEGLRTPASGATYDLDPSEAAMLAEYNVSMETYAVYNLFFELIQIGVFVGVSAWLAFRADDAAAGFVALTLLLTGAIAPAPANVLSTVTVYGTLLLSLQLLRYILTAVFLYIFPDGRFVPGWTLYAALIYAAAIIALPFVAGSPEKWSTLLQAGATLLWLGPGIAAQVIRYRSVSTPEQRQQTRWFLYGISSAVLAALIRGLLSLIPAVQDAGGARLLYYTLISVPILDTVMFVLLPIAIGVSIARFHLYGLSFVVNRSLVYGLVTLLLALVFFLGFFLIQGIVQLFGGSPSLALVIATALTVAVFTPVRRRVRKLVDRRLFGLRVDLTNRRRAAPTVGQDLSDQTIGQYQMTDLIGKGGMGQVYKARHKTLDRTVAVKVLSELYTHDEGFRSRFELEAKTVAALRHPNIVTVYDFGVQGDTYYMVMEYIDGQELSALLKEGGALSLQQTQAIVSDVATALDYAHTQGLVHRDVKPSNVMLRKAPVGARSTAEFAAIKRTTDPVLPKLEDLQAQQNPPALQAVLMDFGIAKVRGTSSGLTATGMLGTLDYAAPEQIMSAKAVDLRADIYALGVMTYQMLTGELPFKGGMGEVVFAHLQAPPPDPRSIRPELSEPLALAVLRALAKQPEERFAAAGEFAAALRAAPYAADSAIRIV
jgi:serine/threonine protein kinase